MSLDEETLKRHYKVKQYFVLVTVKGWYCTTRPMHCCYFLIYLASPSEF